MAGDLIGRTLGGYQIVEQLGRGGQVEPGGTVTGIDICDWYTDTIPPNPQER